jgi:hypothetical protein
MVGNNDLSASARVRAPCCSSERGVFAIPTYTFELRNGARPIEGGAGIPLPDREHAFHYGRTVARELMHGRELQARSWRLDVYEDGQPVSEIPFASVDRTLDHLRPDVRATVECMCERRGMLEEANHAARVTALEARAVIARSRGRLYLAAEAGNPTIRKTG